MYWKWEDPSGKIVFTAKPYWLMYYDPEDHNLFLKNTGNQKIKSFELIYDITDKNGYVINKNHSILFTDIEPGETHRKEECADKRTKFKSGIIKFENGTNITIEPETISIKSNFEEAKSKLLSSIGSAISYFHRPQQRQQNQDKPRHLEP